MPCRLAPSRRVFAALRKSFAPRGLVRRSSRQFKSDAVSLDTASTTLTVAKEVGRGREVAELSERWSAQRKSQLVLRHLGREAVDAGSRESQVPAHEMKTWERIFPRAGGSRAADSRRA